MPYTVLFASICIGLLAAPAANAQCAFDAPAKAKGFKADLVRSYAACPGVTFAAPNTATMAGVPGCSPPTTLSEYRFGPKGRCKVRLKQEIDQTCLCGFPPCTDIFIDLRCSDVRDVAELPVDGGGTWSTNLVIRVTWDDGSFGDMTIIDSPAQLALSPASNGKLRLKVSVMELISAGCFFPIALPTCMETELLSLGLMDPDGKVFAKIGSSTR